MTKSASWGPKPAVLLSAAMIALIAFADWRVDMKPFLGVLYLLPVLLLGTVWNRWQTVLAAAFCTFVSDPYIILFQLDVDRDRAIVTFITLVSAGLFATELIHSHRRERESMEAKRAAEEQLEFVIQSSPAAILTMNDAGEILLANAAAHATLGAASLTGKSIGSYLPALASVPSVDRQAFRAEMQCRGQRESGESFSADVFFSTYKTAQGPRLAALVVDSSEHLRDREESSLEHLLAGSRLLVKAVSHEIRNVCGAIGVIYANLVESGSVRGNQDLEALGSLVDALKKIAALDLKDSGESIQAGPIDLHDVLGDLRIVLEPPCREEGVELDWEIAADLPLAWADRHSLLQALLNLTKNSRRALQAAPRKSIRISAQREGDRIAVRVADSGPGVADPKNLFQPLQKGADANGLGLYLSRAFLRSFGGDLKHETPSAAGCVFVLELPTVAHGTHSLTTA